MINIVHMFNYLGHAGTEISVLNVISELRDKANITIVYSKDGPGRKLFEENDIPLVQIEMNSTFDIKAAKVLKKYCIDNKVDIIHTHFLREHSIAVLSKYFGNKSKIINSRHMLIENSKSVILLNKILSKKTDSIIAVSKAVEQKLINEGIPKNKIVYIPNGINLEKWNEPSKKDIRKEYNIDKDTILITSVARFRWEKGHKFFIDSIRTFYDIMEREKINRKVTFLLVGDGATLEDIKAYSKKLCLENHIIFTGFKDNISDFLKNSDCFICHSQYEAFGISILEAMACKLPVISTDSGGTREIINNDLQNGFLVSYGDKEALAKQMLEIVLNDELRNKIGENAYNSIASRYDLKTVAEKTLEIYLK